MSYAPQLAKIRDRMFRATSKRDLEHMLNNKAKVVVYDQLKDYNSFKELLDPYQSVIILYPNAEDPEIGHWTCIFVIPGTNRVEYFDSYGAYIDEPIGEFNEEKEALHDPQRIEPRLLELLADSPYANNLYFNETPFQSESQATQTCGLWVVMRLKNNYLTENEFTKEWHDLPTNAGLLPDMVVSDVILTLFPEMANYNIPS